MEQTDRLTEVQTYCNIYKEVNRKMNEQIGIGEKIYRGKTDGE